MIVALLVAGALAQDPAPPGGGVETAVDLPIRAEVRARPGPPLPIPADPHASDPPPTPPPADLRDDPKTQLVARCLDVSLDFAAEARGAVDLVYARRYRDARAAFEALDRRYPGEGLLPVGMVILYQALDFENYDDRYAGPYRASWTEAVRRLRDALQQPGLETVEHLLLAAMQGIDGIDALRNAEYLQALDRALAAIGELREVRAAAPDLPDPALGDGMYLYWRTVVIALAPFLPRFADARWEGIQLMQKAEREATLLGPAATLALTFSYLEEGRTDAAWSSYQHGARAYPGNVINNLTGARVLTASGRHAEAVALLDRVLADAPDNQRGWYLRGVAEAGRGDRDAAERAWATYLGFAEVPSYFRGITWLRVGYLRWRHGDRDSARAAWQESVHVSGNDEAKAALARLAR